MWGKNSKPVPEAPVQRPAVATATPVAAPAAPVAPAIAPPVPAQAPAPTQQSSTSARIGAAIFIRGEIRGREDLRIEGEVQGSIELDCAVVSIGQAGRVRADVSAREIVVEGRVEGSITATERVRISSSGDVKGDILAQRIAIEEGAVLRGSVETARESLSARKQSVSAKAAEMKSKVNAGAEASIESKTPQETVSVGSQGSD